MKFFPKTSAFFALFSALLAFSACSDNSSAPSAPTNPIGNLSDEEKEQLTSVNSNGDTIVVLHETVYDTEGNEITYYSEGVFCWTEECEKKYASSSSKAPTSSASSTKPNSSSAKAPAVTISSSSAVPPSVDLASGTMVDNRDKTPYSIEVIGKLIWMSENLRYKPASGTTCIKNKEGENFCDLYGMYYDYATAKKACPSGWRLPTLDEFNAAWKATTAEEDGINWWTLGGRIKDNANGQEGSIGYIWIAKDAQGHITVQYQKSGTDPLSNERAYNVRCVTENK